MLSPALRIFMWFHCKPGFRWPRYRQGVAIGACLLLAAGLRLWRLDQNGFGNLYYSAAVRSMQADSSNFFFGSFDPLGMVTVDKPPFALWIQAASALLFGYNGLAVLAPQALMGTASVCLTYHLVHRQFGFVAGLLAALALAIMPICVAVDRDNLPDSALVLVLLLAFWAQSRAVESGRLAWQLSAMALIGLGFNVKMLAAFVVLPPFFLVYLWMAPGGWRKRLRSLGAGAAVALAVSLSWTLAVELTPKSRRPFIGGSENNSALELALGYNGMARVFGMTGLGPPGLGPPGTRPSEPGGGSAGVGPSAMPPFPGGRFPGGFGGPPGFLRFASVELAEAVTWLLPIAIIGGTAAALRLFRSRAANGRTCGLLLWAGWLGTHWIVFSFARGIFHDYYSTVMGPAVAALFGIGTVALGEESGRRGWRAALLPAALLLTAAWQCFIVWRHPDLRAWLIPIVAVIAVLCVVVAFAANRLAACSPAVHWVSIGAAAAGVASVLICPFIWSLTPVMAKGNPVLPTAGPLLLGERQPLSRMPPMPPFELDQVQLRKLRDFLVDSRQGERILVASLESMSVSPIIVETGLPAVALGGFMGRDPVVTKREFIELVEHGQLRFVLLGTGPGGAPGLPSFDLPPGAPSGIPLPGRDAARPSGNSGIAAWVREHGRPVDPKLWRADETESTVGPEDVNASTGVVTPVRPFRKPELYDCRPELRGGGKYLRSVSSAIDAGKE